MTLAPKHLCSGCSACHDACPKDAVMMIADKEGFLYPMIDTVKCVGCGLCTRACPTLNRSEPRKPLAVYAAKAKDTDLRLASSSGGIFSLLSRQILSKGGRVYGAAFDKRDWSVEHIGVSDEDGLSELRGSKYVQSRTSGIYRQVKADLEKGVPVLFSGTPCQIAALRLYLGKPYDNLYLVDVICHAVPSPLVWQKYLDWRCEAASAQGRGSAPAEGRNIRRISFRHKNCGWKRFSLSLRFANDKEYLCDYQHDAFLRAFLSELCNRPSCHECSVRELRSGADLTIADYWEIDHYLPEIDDDKGVSMVLVHTESGRDLFTGMIPRVDVYPSNWNTAKLCNSALIKSPVAHGKRKWFIDAVVCGCASEKLVSRVLRKPILLRIRLFLGRILRKLGFLR